MPDHHIHAFVIADVVATCGHCGRRVDGIADLCANPSCLHVRCQACREAQVEARAAS